MSQLREGFGDFIEKLATLYTMGSDEDNKEQQEKQKKLEQEHAQKLKEVDAIQKKLEKKLADIDKKEKELARKDSDISARERKHKEEMLQRREDDIKNMLKKIEDQHGILTKQEQERAKMLMKKEKDMESLIKSQKFDYEDEDENSFEDLNSIENRLKDRMSQVEEPEEPEIEEEEEDGDFVVHAVSDDEDDILNKIAGLFAPTPEEEEEDEEDDVDESASPGTVENPFGEDDMEEYEDALEDQEPAGSLISDTSGDVDILTKLKDKMAGTQLSFDVQDGYGSMTDVEDFPEDQDGPAEDPEEEISDEIMDRAEEEEIEDEQEEYESGWDDNSPANVESDVDQEEFEDEEETEESEDFSEGDDDETSKEKIIAMMKDILDKRNDPDDPPTDPKTGKDILFGDEDVAEDDGEEEVSACGEDFTEMPPIDRERYTDIEGLEGPFMQKSGKVLYYDPKEGKYYDRDSDMYLSDEDYMAHDTPRKSAYSEGSDILDRIARAEKILNIMEAPGDPNDKAPPSDPDAPVQQGEDPLAGPDAPIDDGSEPLPEDEEELPIEFEDKTKQIEDSEDYNLSSNNSYDFYDRIRGILNDAESIKALNQEYETIPMNRRKITPAKYLFDKVLNNIKEKRKRSSSSDMGMGGPMGGAMGMGDLGMGGGPMGSEVGMGGPMGGDMGAEAGGAQGGGIV